MKPVITPNHIRRFVYVLIAILLIVVAASAAAHKYFFAITDIHHNKNTHSLEIIHQLTAHDIENAIAEQLNISFNPEHESYETIIKQYIESHFQITKDNRKLPITWVGVENVRDKVVVYQEVKNENFLSRLVVKNQLLVDTYAKQVNTVNFESGSTQISLTFNESQRIGIIANNN